MTSIDLGYWVEDKELSIQERFDDYLKASEFLFKLFEEHPNIKVLYIRHYLDANGEKVVLRGYRYKNPKLKKEK